MVAKESCMALPARLDKFLHSMERGTNMSELNWANVALATLERVFKIRERFLFANHQQVKTRHDGYGLVHPKALFSNTLSVEPRDMAQNLEDAQRCGGKRKLPESHVAETAAELVVQIQPRTQEEMEGHEGFTNGYGSTRSPNRVW
ncbi:hypothetical protein VOLCADRAFT_98122 [Volvox carteri f. nagariensis]|uniref:Uncharacterized protein n=1 Tax=Volvox carteri f. nagariensis TaxID=3068 RepID=D8UEI0_VOLCA|nr:uncharacterized protein VOLCADRAFT_98122 [Volvox carteri f. nagariensis]EFJ41848.1 hypothetical protein VOLCADRAFT_98122 [Volvox carteri f. nagariensis]|eukprot:XP_002957046.1 hypothetical protein VOLCADRAFT_98122 [Volvox carteri f. nagariensis]